LIVSRLLTLMKLDDLTIVKEAKIDGRTARSPRGDWSFDRQNEADDVTSTRSLAVAKRSESSSKQAKIERKR